MIHISKNNFLSPSNTLSITAANGFEAGKLYGRAVKKPDITHTDLTHKQAHHLLNSAENYKNSSLFMIHNRNYLSEYLDILYGYCDGAGITKEEGILLQADLASGCQTLFVQNRADKSIGLLHTEENSDDRNLAQLYRYIHSHEDWTPNLQLPDELESLYSYKMVDMTIGNSDFSFFGYPELCFGGPAMGINITTGVFMAVDTIHTVTPFTENSLWANAIASMIFLAGTIDNARQLLKRLSSARIPVYNGYVIHLADTKSLTMTSFEFGGPYTSEVPPEVYNNLMYIAQSNYPKSKELEHIDELYVKNIQSQPWDIWNAQTSLEMRRRLSHLKDMCKHNTFTFDSSLPDQMDTLMYSQDGDLETDFYDTKWKSFTGFISPCLAGYATGILTSNYTDITIGKLYPYVPSKKRSRLWYCEADPIPVEYTDLYKSATAYKSSTIE